MPARALERRRALGSGALFLGLLAAVWYFVLRQVPLGALRAALAAADPACLAAAMGAMGLYFLCEGRCTSRGLGRFGHRVGLWEGVGCAATGFFFSAVTPSATGGQPMVLHRMHRRGADPAHGALVLLLELACWKVLSALLGLAGLWMARRDLAALPGAARAVLLGGAGLNLAVLAAVLAALLRPAWAIRLGAWLRARRGASRLCRQGADGLDRFARAAPRLRRMPGLAAETLALTAAQLLALYSVSYWSLRALGAAGLSAWEVLARQAAVNLAVSSLPLPGAMGAGEGGFLALLGPAAPPALAGAAMVLSRGVSFYLPVAVTGLALLIPRFMQKNTASDR